MSRYAAVPLPAPSGVSELSCPWCYRRHPHLETGEARGTVVCPTCRRPVHVRQRQVQVTWLEKDLDDEAGTD